tara:strand:+ start:5993 stop:7720 length:1728 start_codon:yes stop_codon:yes gene_type:complete
MAKKSPLKINESLVKRTRLTSNYTSGEKSTMGRWNTDNLFDSSKQTMANRMINNEEKSLKEENRNPDTYSNTGTYSKHHLFDPTLPIYPNQPQTDAPEKKLTKLEEKQKKLEEILQKTDGKENFKTKRLRRQIKKLIDFQTPLAQRVTEKITPENKLDLGLPYSDSYLRSRGMDPKDYRMLSDDAEKSKIRQAPITPAFFDPNEKGSTRDSYLPGKIVYKDGIKYYQASDGTLHTGQIEDYEKELQQDREMFPDGPPPMKQLEQPIPGGVLPEVTIYDTFNTIDAETFEEKKQDYIENFRFGSKAGARIDTLGNKTWKEATRGWLKNVQENIFNAIGDGETDIAAKWMDNTRNLINNIKIFENKKVEDFGRQFTDEIKGNTGGSIMSKGSHKGDMRKYDMTYMGANNINLEISEDGDMFFKMEGIDDVWSVKDLGRNTFSKNFQGALRYDEIKQSLIDSAKQNKPFSKNALEGSIDSLLVNKEAILSFAHDDLGDNKALFDLYEKAARERGLKINIEPFMPESQEFDLKRVKNMVKKGLVSQAEEVYNAHLSNYAKENVDKAEKMSAKDLIEKYK